MVQFSLLLMSVQSGLLLSELRKQVLIVRQCRVKRRKNTGSIRDDEFGSSPRLDHRFTLNHIKRTCRNIRIILHYFFTSK